MKQMKKWIWISGALLLFVIGYTVKVYVTAISPLKDAEEKAVEIAKKEASIVSVDEFSIYNGSKTYYVVSGKNDEGIDSIVWVPEDGGKPVIKKKKEGISKEEAIKKLLEQKEPEEIVHVKLGVENNIPLWEIYYRSNDDLINYYYVDFESGEWLKDIQNL